MRTHVVAVTDDVGGRDFRRVKQSLELGQTWQLAEEPTSAFCKPRFSGQDGYVDIFVGHFIFAVYSAVRVSYGTVSQAAI